MKHHLLLFICFIFMATSDSFCQDYKFFAVVPDTVAQGEPFEVKFTLEDGKGEIEAPEFYGLKIVGGPNQSYTTAIVNGDMSQSMSISYTVVAEEEGEWVIERATAEIDGTFVESEPVTIVVNKEGPVIQKHLTGKDDFVFDDPFRLWNKKPEIKTEKPKLSKKDSILKKYKVKKF